MTRIQSVTTPGGWLVTGNSDEIRRLRERRLQEAAELTSASTPDPGESMPAETGPPVSRLKRWIIHPLLRRIPIAQPTD
ncbi:MAG: hypothetical protein RL885_20185 [Planctomycetota bacterium]